MKNGTLSESIGGTSVITDRGSPVNSPSISLVRRFASIFAGRKEVWGALRGCCVKEEVTLNHYSRHLAGAVSLGIYPLREDGTCRWFAIDLDHDDPAPALRIMEGLSSAGFNQGLYLERSKSKGFHVLGFLSDWAPSAPVRRIARGGLARGGLPISTEVFPKQDDASLVRYGNYMNLPYFGRQSREGRRMILDTSTLTAVALSDWLDSFRPFPVSAIPTVLSNMADPGPRGGKAQAHQDTAKMFTRPLAVGERRPTLVRLAGYLRYRGIPEEAAVALLLPWARAMFEEPLPTEEIKKHIRGIYQRYGGPRVFLPEEEVLGRVPDNLMTTIKEVWR